jgi:aldehyde dehydrogenase (NAD+)
MAAKLQNLIGGQWLDPTGDSSRALLNPADGVTTLAEFTESSAADIDQAVAAAAAAFPSWRDMPVVRRCRILFHCKETVSGDKG